MDSSRHTHHRRIAAAALLASVLLLPPASRVGGIVPPRNGGKLPAAVIERRLESKDAFAPKRAWIRRRDRQLGGEIAFRPMRSCIEGTLTAPHLALSGTLRLPVLLGAYSDIPDPSVQDTTLQRLLFDGPSPAGIRICPC